MSPIANLWTLTLWALGAEGQGPLRFFVRILGLEERKCPQRMPVDGSLGNPGNLQGLASLLGKDCMKTLLIYTEPSEEELAERMERVETGFDIVG